LADDMEFFLKFLWLENQTVQWLQYSNLVRLNVV